MASVRVNLSLTPELVAVLDRMGAVTGAGRATVIKEWLESAVPQLSQLADALELAAKKNVDAWKVMERSVRDAASASDQLHLDIRTQRRKAQRRQKKDQG